ncbi:FAD-dependent oxidoreductase [Cryptosporangium sp. NPDC051539]|uniref:FAD-dependent oxidoreductase n=1 Tax=Cryptosporangium sp. NPDC051539 TaxID=3363962 RepID=UPI0037B11BC6
MLIVGAGPAGLTLACDLVRRGVRIRLIEAAPAPAPGSRGKGLQPRTLEVFEDFGLIDEVLAGGRMAMPIQSIAPDGRVTPGGAVPDALAGRPDIPYTTSLIIPQWRTEEVLRSRLSELGGEVEFGTSLSGFEQTDDGVTAHIVNRGQPATLTVQWLVGCDGGHSTVRKQAGLAFPGETRDDVRMIVADARVEGLDREAWRIWRHAEGIVALCPLPATSTFQFQAGISPGQNAELSLSNLQAILDRRTGRADLRLHEPTWSSLWRANIRLVDHYRDGRVLLAGDAAHIHSPAGGQGMNTGIQDAVNLGWKLAAVVDGARPNLLDTYESERRPVAAHVLGLSTSRLDTAIETNELPTGRDAGTIQLDIGYRGSVLAHDDRDDSAALRAGDRAPDATGLVTPEGDRRLFDLVRGGHFVLLCFGGAGESATPRFEVQRLRVTDDATAPGDLVDSADHLRRTYDAGSRTIVLVRPDGYVGLISDAGDASAVTRYLGEFF